MNKFNRNQLTQSISMALVGSVVAVTIVTPVQAQDEETALLEEVVVTATKRVQNLQDVPISLQVLGQDTLENLGVRSFEDFIAFLPTVSYASGGPGFAQIYMRGIASGGDGNHSASMPSVGYYLDEQPVTTINQVLDIYMYDIARVETLAGPQGTLFGQGSQAGTIRIITNKPQIGVSEGGYDVELNTTKNGSEGYNLQGFWNIPLGERAAIRLVAWHKDDGDLVRAGEELFELETDKVTVAVPADVAGRLSVDAQEGTQVKVGQTVGRIDTDAVDQLAEGTPPVEEQAAATLSRPPEPAPAAVAPSAAADGGGSGPPLSPPAGIEQAKASLSPDGPAPPLSPAVRRLVEQHGLGGAALDGSIGAVVADEGRARPLEALLPGPPVPGAQQVRPVPVRVQSTLHHVAVAAERQRRKKQNAHKPNAHR